MLNAIVLALVCAVYLLLTIVVLINNSKARLNRIFAALLLTIPSWSIVVFLEDAPFTKEIIGTLARADYALASTMIGLFYWFCVAMTQKSRRFLNVLVATLAILSAALSLSGKMTTVILDKNDIVLQPLPGYPIFIILLVVGLAGGLGTLLWRYLTTRGRERAQVAFVGIGLLLTAVVLTVALVIAPRIFNLSGADVTRFGLHGTLFFAALSTYAVIRHKFMDIRQAVARSLTYLLVLVALMTLYTGAVFGLIRVFFDGRNFDVGQTYIYTISAVFLAFTYEPLKAFFDRVTDRIFYRNEYNPQVVLDAIGDVTSSQIDLNKLAQRSVKILQDALKPDAVVVYISPLNNETRPYQFFHSGQLVHDSRSIIPFLEKTKGEIIIADQLDRNSALYKNMHNTNVQVIVRLQTSHELMGYLLFGAKQSGKMYDARDTQMLNTVADELALAIQNSLRFQEIRDFNETLQSRVRDATAQLRQTNTKLHALDEAKDEFISMASHQLRTPLTSVKGYLSMVLDGDMGKVTPEQRKVLEEAFNSSQRMVYLISDFLNVSRIQTGKFELERTQTNLAEVLSDEIEQLRVMASSRNLKINYAVPSHFPAAYIDQDKFRQVMMNFIDNAIYYSNPNTTITISLTKEVDDIVFKVMDQGIGVPSEERHKLFTKFYRASNAKKQRPDGTGIGLFMAQKVIVAHGGSVVFESKENQGSTFGFRLPLKNNLK